MRTCSARTPRSAASRDTGMERAGLPGGSQLGLVRQSTLLVRPHSGRPTGGSSAPAPRLRRGCVQMRERSWCAMRRPSVIALADIGPEKVGTDGLRTRRTLALALAALVVASACGGSTTASPTGTATVAATGTPAAIGSSPAVSASPSALDAQLFASNYAPRTPANTAPHGTLVVGSSDSLDTLVQNAPASRIR